MGIVFDNDQAINAELVEPYLLIHTQYNPLSGSTFYVSAEWIGDPSKPIVLNRKDYFTFKDLIPYELERLPIDENLWSLNETYIRTDRGLWYAYYRFQADWLNLLRFFQSIKCRLILTAEVWGLAYVPRVEIPSWSHLGKSWFKA